MSIALRFVGSQHRVSGGAAPRGAVMQQAGHAHHPHDSPHSSLRGSSPNWETSWRPSSMPCICANILCNADFLCNAVHCCVINGLHHHCFPVLCVAPLCIIHSASPCWELGLRVVKHSHHLIAKHVSCSMSSNCGRRP